MALKRIVHRTLGNALKEEGLLPENCRFVELLVPPDGLPTLRFTVLVMDEDLPKLARAMMRACGKPDADPSAPEDPS